MRTKLLIGAAVLGAGLVSLQAQVYSLNVVGYVNQTVTGGKWHILGNPLKVTGANTSSTVLTNLSGTPDLWAGATVYTFDPGTRGYGNPDQFFYAPADSFIGWFESGDVVLNPGTGFWFYAPNNGVITFVGEVVTTNTFNLAGTKWNLVASAFPASLSLQGLGLQGYAAVGNTDGGDFVYRFGAKFGGGYDNGIRYYNLPADSVVGWFSGDAGDTSGPEGPALDVAEGIWYYEANGAGQNWVRSFTIN